jgi:glucose/arabinose dehydrogenase
MRRFYTLLITTLILLSQAYAQPEIDFEVLSLSGPALSQPVDIMGNGSGSSKLYVVEKRGTVRVIDGTTVQSAFFLDIQTQVMNSGERGLLGMAFHPNYPDSPYVYVNYVITGTITNRISRFTVDPETDYAIEGSQLPLFEVTGVQSNHKAGDLAFGPDGYLYIGTGDGGGGGDPAEAGQNLETLLGKILRIDVNTTTGNLNYGIPPSNPFVGVAGLDEIWAYGIRNPWRISFDRATGDLWIADVGQNLWEEIDYVPAGTPGGINFGWDCFEGTHEFESSGCNGIVQWEPIYEYPHSCSGCPNGASVTGGFVYRGDQYPLLQGWYIFVDYISNWIWLIQPDPGGGAPDVVTVQGNSMINDVVAFGEGDNGELYATSLQGTIYKVTEESSLPLQWTDLAATRITNGPKPGNKIDWSIHLLAGIDHFAVERSLTPAFTEVASLGHILPVEDQYNYSFTDLFNQSIGVYYRVVAHMQDGSRELSPVVRLLPDALAKPALVFNPNLNLWNINLPDIWQSGELILLDLQGKEVFRKTLSSEKVVGLGPPIIPGAYFIQIKNGTETWSDKVVL